MKKMLLWNKKPFGTSMFNINWGDEISHPWKENLQVATNISLLLQGCNVRGHFSVFLDKRTFTWNLNHMPI